MRYCPTSGRMSSQHDAVEHPESLSSARARGFSLTGVAIGVQTIVSKSVLTALKYGQNGMFRWIES